LSCKRKSKRKASEKEPVTLKEGIQRDQYIPIAQIKIKVKKQKNG